MKYFILPLVLLFSTLTYSIIEHDFKNIDFAPFPLNTERISLFEGVWQGKIIDIHVKNSGHVFNRKPILRVKVINHYFKDIIKEGLMYYSSSLNQYKLYLFTAERSFPIELGVFVFSSSYASEFNLKCKSGGTLLKIEFKIDGVLEKFFAIKENCF